MKSTTRSSLSTSPLACIFFSAASVAAPSGHAKIPSALLIWLTLFMISWSVTLMQAPPLSRAALSTRKSPSALGTLSPAASVEAFWKYSLSSLPSSYALTMGAQPSAWTLIILGRSLPIQPSSSSASKTFHMPMMPVPPPVG